MQREVKLGVLAVQGDVEEHIYALRRACLEMGIPHRIVEVKLPKHLTDIDGIVIPGGESTTIGRLSERKGLLEILRKEIEGGLPVFGTCAGMIMLAKEVRDAVVGEKAQPILGVMNISVIRNVFGRQKDSFEIDLDIPEIGKIVRAVFIRAPAIIRCWGRTRPLARIMHEKLGELIVLAREDNMLACAFHPELTKDTTIHRYFLQMVLEYRIR